MSRDAYFIAVSFWAAPLLRNLLKEILDRMEWVRDNKSLLVPEHRVSFFYPCGRYEGRRPLRWWRHE